jgi:hypothetical protein
MLSCVAKKNLKPLSPAGGEDKGEGSCSNFKTYFRDATLSIDRLSEGTMSRMLMAGAIILRVERVRSDHRNAVNFCTTQSVRPPHSGRRDS